MSIICKLSILEEIGVQLISIAPILDVNYTSIVNFLCSIDKLL